MLHTAQKGHVSRLEIAEQMHTRLKGRTHRRYIQHASMYAQPLLDTFYLTGIAHDPHGPQERPRAPSQQINASGARGHLSPTKHARCPARPTTARRRAKLAAHRASAARMRSAAGGLGGFGPRVAESNKRNAHVDAGRRGRELWSLPRRSRCRAKFADADAVIVRAAVS